MFRNSSGRIPLCLAAACFVGSILIPPPAQAGWHRSEEELPGMTSTKELVLIGLGTAAVVTVIALAVRASKDSDDKPAPAESDSTVSGTVDTSTLGASPEVLRCLATAAPSAAPTGARAARLPLEVEFDLPTRGVAIGVSRGF